MDSEVKRNVLVIAYYFPPMGLSGVQRTLKFVKYLPENGWNPIVLTNGAASYYAHDETLLSELPDGVEIYRTGEKFSKPGLRKFPGNYFIQRIGRAVLETFYLPDSKIRWKNYAISKANEIIKTKNIHAIFATAPPFTDFLIGLELSHTHDIPFVVDYRDTWVDNPFHFYATPFHKNFSVRAEKSILTYSEKAIVTNRHAKELILKRYRFLSHDDVTIIPHGYDSEDFELAGEPEKDGDKFIITHSGLFQDNRTPKYFLKALSEFFKNNPEAKKNVEARFVGLMRKSHLRLVSRYKLWDNVVATGYLPHVDSVRELKKADVLWLMMKDTVRSPGKLYEYFGAGKPILISTPKGTMRNLALETQAAAATEYNDVKAITEAIATYYEQWKKGNLPKPDEKFTSGFDRQKLTQDLARELSLAIKI